MSRQGASEVRTTTIVGRWRAVKRWVATHSFAINASVFSVLCLLSVSDVLFNAGDRGRHADVFAYVLLFGQTLPLAFRRRYPLGSMYTVCVSIGLYWVLDYPLGFDGAAVIAIYSGAAYGLARRRTWKHITIAIATVTALGLIPWFRGQQDDGAIVAFAFAAVHLAAALLGEVVYQRRQRIADLEQRAIQAEENLELRAHMAVADERQRIAREMHDVVAHGMSVIAVQAAAAQEIARTDPDKTVEVLANIETVGRDSLNELRRMLGVLRDTHQPGSSLAPQPSLDDLAGAVAQSMGAGLPTQLVINGRQRPLPAGIELAAYRIAQEALTNARKHAGDSASATVCLSYLDDSITIEVTDDGVGAMSSLATTGAGNGLLGMRERVAIYGGELAAGARHGGGYSVRATLPVADTDHRPSVASAASTTPKEIS